MNRNIERVGKGDGNVELLIAFGANDGESLTNGHAGDARLFHI
jgi:hypothetical protein